MMHGHAVHNKMTIAQLPKQSFGKKAVDDLRFLKTQNVRRFFLQEPLNDVDTGANRVYIPRGDANGLGHRNTALDVRSRWSKPVKAHQPKKAKPSSRGHMG